MPDVVLKKPAAKVLCVLALWVFGALVQESKSDQDVQVRQIWRLLCPRTDHCLCTFRYDDTDTGVLNALGVSSKFKPCDKSWCFMVFLYLYIYNIYIYIDIGPANQVLSCFVPNVGIEASANFR